MHSNELKDKYVYNGAHFYRTHTHIQNKQIAMIIMICFYSEVFQHSLSDSSIYTFLLFMFVNCVLWKRAKEINKSSVISLLSMHS